MVFAGMSFAQNDYDDLLELIVDQNYPRCLVKALRYTEADATKKDPLPYLYMSMAYFRIHQSDDPKYAEQYPKAFKESIKMLVKHRKKDKQNEFYAEFADYIEEVRTAIWEEAEKFYFTEKYTKSKSYYKYMCDIDKKDPGAWALRGLSQLALKSKKDSGESFAMAKELVDAGEVEHLSKNQMNYFKNALIIVAEYYEQIGNKTEALTWLDLGKEYFSDDKEFNVTYEMMSE